MNIIWLVVTIAILLTRTCQDYDEALQVANNQLEELQKEIEQAIPQNETVDLHHDDATIDNIIQYNNISIQAKYDQDHHVNTTNDFLLHEDMSLLQNLTEGDLLLDKEDMELLRNNETFHNHTEIMFKRTLIPYARKLWFSRVVPYEIDHEGTKRLTDEKVKETVRKSMDIISALSCLRFRPKVDSDTNWLKFFKGSGCYSGIGKKYWAKGPSRISLGNYCVFPPIIVHEIFHSLGFFHEQSRPDRDSFVKIFWENIVKGMENNFERHVTYDAQILDTPYDISSLMHYGRTAFSKNGKETIVAKFDQNRPLSGKYVTAYDRAELNKMYQCNKAQADILVDPWSKWSEWSADCFTSVKRCVRLRQRYCLDSFTRCVGADAFGVQDHTVNCPPENCTVETLAPHWSEWSDYGTCSRECDDGIRTRTRDCNNPFPKQGMQCKGHPTQTSYCRTKKCRTGNLDTDFESGFGEWRQDSEDKLDWKLQKGATAVEETGPKSDHTTKDGYYAFVSAVKSSESKKVGRLVSTMIPARSGPRCVTFFYQMNGKSMGQLDWFIRTKNAKFWTFWHRKGHQGNYWSRGAFTVPNLSESYEIVIEGKTGKAPDTDIAVDDIQIDDKVCVQGTQGCSNYDGLCDYWKSVGECYKNSVWMTRACCMSCFGMAECTDKNPMCKGWAGQGECKNNAKYMWSNCCQSCRDGLD